MNGLFVGLITVDLIYLTDNFPSSNQKIVALDQAIVAGGPATNAAVTFSYLGNCATLLGVVGNHPLGQLINNDLSYYSVEVIDLNPQKTDSPAISSIIVTRATGERAVVSLNAVKSQVSLNQLPANILNGIDLVLIDGHQMAVSQAIVVEAKQKGIPVVIDGGSWKSGFENIIPWVDYAICSDNFYPPNCHNRHEIFTYLQAKGISHIAITQGEKPIQYLSQGEFKELTIPRILAVDTLGAGDIFHGAFCHYINNYQFRDSLAAAAQVAANSCQYFGTRQWMQNTMSNE